MQLSGQNKFVLIFKTVILSEFLQSLATGSALVVNTKKMLHHYFCVFPTHLPHSASWSSLNISYFALWKKYRSTGHQPLLGLIRIFQGHVMVQGQTTWKCPRAVCPRAGVLTDMLRNNVKSDDHYVASWQQVQPHIRNWGLYNAVRLDQGISANQFPRDLNLLTYLLTYVCQRNVLYHLVGVLCWRVTITWWQLICWSRLLYSK